MVRRETLSKSWLMTFSLSRPTAEVLKREKPKKKSHSRKEWDAMQEKTIKLIIKIAEIAICVAILIKDFFNGESKNDSKGNPKTK